jgi:DNA gyrase subunit B
VINHGAKRDYILTRDFILSVDYLAFSKFGEYVSSLVKAGGVIEKGEKSEPISNFEQALEWLQKEALRGHSRQRYKGLGEMNPDQLWSTTMDPKERSMLRVTIEDAIAADHMFNTLMGDNVEPRKNFIVENALSVSNLDI